MEKKFLTGKTPDGRWLVTVIIDADKKLKRLDFEEAPPAGPNPPHNPENHEWKELDDLLI